MGTRSGSRLIYIVFYVLGLSAPIAFCQQGTGAPPDSIECQTTLCVTSDADVVPAEQGPSKALDADEQKAISLKRAFLNLPGDQKAIWTSPFKARRQDTFWLVPLAAATGVLVGSDQHSMSRARSNADAISLSNRISDGGLLAMVALPGAMYVWGSFAGASRARETGLLSGEAMIDSLAVNETFKLVFARERPTPTDVSGKFFQGPVSDDSFPSLHATLSWTAASVIAHEYPGWLPQSLAYGTAMAVSITRVTGREHFPSDVVVGSALGWLIGRQIYNAHHNPDLDGAIYGNFGSLPGEEIDPASPGSPFVPLDSWVYPELRRLAARGYVKTQFTGLEPWTRAECRRQIDEAAYFAQDLPDDSDVAQAIRLLREEFSREPNRYYTAQLDSVYSRYTQISGTPLRNSYHFGQTLWNDFGRPYDEGSNVITGATASAVAGPFFFYAQGEYQHAPGRGPLTDAQRQLIANVDRDPVLPPAPVNTIDRFYPIDLYAGVKLGEYSVTFGKQSLWLGPTRSGPLMVSDNADPMYMLHLNRTSPLVLPGFLHWIGEIRGEFLFAKLSGHQFAARPFFNLQKISFHPTQNLEIGFTRASLWAGVGHPFTAHSLARNLFSLADSRGGFGDPNDPGDRKSGFDFSYRVPGLRNWLTIYSDMYSDDDPSPLANPRRAAVNPGFYISHVPGLSKVDLRAEATSTQLLTSFDLGPDFLYFNGQYHDANTNKSFLFGNSTGRDARSYQGWTSYHFSARDTMTLGFRQLKASNLFLPGGGTQTDASIRMQWRVHAGVTVAAFVQHERWLIPVLRLTPQDNVTGQLQLTYTPHWRVFSD